MFSMTFLPWGKGVWVGVGVGVRNFGPMITDRRLYFDWKLYMGVQRHHQINHE